MVQVVSQGRLHLACQSVRPALESRLRNASSESSSSTSSETGEFVPIELCLELFTGGMDAAHHRADRDVLGFGDFSVTQAQFSK